MNILIFEIVLALAALLIYFTFDTYLTKKRLDINQREWDEYSKGMTKREKLNCFYDFVTHQKAKYGWKFLYIPQIGLDNCVSDDEFDNLDIEKLAKMSNKELKKFVKQYVRGESK